MRVAGVNIPKEKRLEIALTYIFGIGLVTSQGILKEAGIGEEVRTKDLKPEEEDKLRNIIEKKFKIEGDLKNGLAWFSFEEVARQLANELDINI